MNVAVIITNHNLRGGAFQYELLNLKILKENSLKDINYLYYCNSKSIINSHNDNFKINFIKKNFFEKIFDFILSFEIINKNLIIISNTLKRPKLKFLNKINLNFYFSLENKLNKDNIDLVYFTSPSSLFKQIRNLPFVFTVFDLNFHSHNHFPELSNNNEFLNRYRFYFESLNRAFKIIVCSDFLKKQIIKCYNISSNRIVILPYLPNKIELQEKKNIYYKKKYNLNYKYIFYPASYYPHKNHLYVLKVIDYLNNSLGEDIKVYFVGSTGLNSTFNFLKKKAAYLKIDKNVIFYNFVENESIPYFYKNAICLLMPSFNGPNNIPPLEAIIYDCPVLYSDLPEFHEQFDDLVEYINLNDPKSAAKKIIKLDKNESYRSERIKFQLSFFKKWDNIKFSKKLNEIFLKYFNLSKNWKDYD